MDTAKDERAVRLDGSHFAVLGTPNATTEVNGNVIKTHDEYGLPMDPAVYAKSKCKDCHGRGLLGVKRAMTYEQAEEQFGGMVKAQHTSEEGTLNESAARRHLERLAKANWTESVQPCGCALRRYHNARLFMKLELENNPPLTQTVQLDENVDLSEATVIAP